MERTGDYRVIERLIDRDQYHGDPNAEKLIGVYLDVETTGLDPGHDKIIELGLVQFEFCAADGRIFRVLDQIDMFQDPGFPLPEKITSLTGITNTMVQGQRIDQGRVRSLIDPAVVIIAHNAAFDRPFVESEQQMFTRKAWACSIANIDWDQEEIGSSKLGYIAYRLGTG